MIGPFTGTATGERDSSWCWRKCPLRKFVCDNSYLYPIIRYRVLRPRALLDLIEMVENLPERVDA